MLVANFGKHKKICHNLYSNMLNPEHEHVFFFVSGFLKIILKEISNYNYINFIAFRVTESHSKLTSYPGLWVKSSCM